MSRIGESEETLNEFFWRIFYILFVEKEDKNVGKKNPQKENLKEIIGHLDNISNILDRADTFSKNELLEDISSSSLKFLLVPFLQAEATYNLQDGSSRIHDLEKSQEFIEQFLNLCTFYRIQGPLPPRNYYHNDNDSSNRSKKIWLKKEQKRLESELWVFLKRYWNPSASVHGKNIEMEDLNLDEENYRNYMIQCIHLFQMKANELLDMIHRELDILKQKANISENKDKTSEHDSSFTKPLEPFVLLPSSTSPTNLSSDIYTITSPKHKQLDRVFRPGYNLPTMTIDEYLSREMKMGNIISQKGLSDSLKSNRARPYGAHHTSKKDEESSEENDDETTLQKQREWDEFRDENPRGWGNRKRTG